MIPIIDRETFRVFVGLVLAMTFILIVLGFGSEIWGYDSLQAGR